MGKVPATNIPEMSRSLPDEGLVFNALQRGWHRLESDRYIPLRFQIKRTTGRSTFHRQVSNWNGDYESIEVVPNATVTLPYMREDAPGLGRIADTEVPPSIHSDFWLEMGDTVHVQRCDGADPDAANVLFEYIGIERIFTEATWAPTLKALDGTFPVVFAALIPLLGLVGRFLT